MEVIIFVGLQASGKSYFYNSRFAATHVHVSKDLMRNAKDRNSKQTALIEESLKKGKSVVVDNTNPRILDRTPLIALGRQYGAKVIAYYFDAPVKSCIERNRKREGKARVPDVAIYVTSKRLQKPEPSEGFDQIFTVTV
jgi:predicted kinase